MLAILPKPHQWMKAQELVKKFLLNNFAYLQGEPRTGKTLTSILACEELPNVSRVLVLTKKKALIGWSKFIIGRRVKFDVINYEQLGNIEKNSKGKPIRAVFKKNSKDYDLVIVDESHNYGVLGKPSGRVTLLKIFASDLPHIHLSGTAFVESPNTIYSQMAISKYTPFAHRNFYEFFKDFGKPYTKKVMGVDRPFYDKVADLDRLMKIIDSFTVYITQEEAGISKEMGSKDVMHYIKLSDSTKKIYNDISTYGITTCNLEGEDIEIVADTKLKERMYLHQIEGGTVKIADKYYLLGNTEKIDYIREKFGDSEDIGIMCHFIKERELINKLLPNVKTYSSDGDSEGVDLSHLKHFIIYSSYYSGAKFIQRKERIVNMNGSNTLEVHHLLVEKALSEQIYKKVSKKEDFNNFCYNRSIL